MSANYQVYVLRSNDEGREYVGMSQDANARWLQHQATARSTSNKPIYVAMKKFGAENFSFTVVGNHSSRNDAKKHERELISELIDSGQKPYNLQSYRASLCVEDDLSNNKISARSQKTEIKLSAMAKRTELVQLALTKEEKQKLQSAADALAIPLASWVRSHALTEASHITLRIKGAA